MTPGPRRRYCRCRTATTRPAPTRSANVPNRRPARSGTPSPNSSGTPRGVYRPPALRPRPPFRATPRARPGTPVVFSPAWLDDRLMEWSMGDPAVKVQLFRFIDALPNLKSAEEIALHLRDYFNEAGEHLPGWMRRAVSILPERGVGGRLLA